MKRIGIAVALVVLTAVASLPAGAAPAQLASLSAARGGGAILNSPAGFGFGYAFANTFVQEAGPIPGVPTTTGPGGLDAYVAMCTSAGCDFGYSPTATGSVPLDLTMSGGTVTVTVPSSQYSGGTLTMTYTYVGYGQYYFGHSIGSGYGNIDPSAPALGYTFYGNAGLQRAAILVSATFASSSLGSINGTTGNAYTTSGVNGVVSANT